MKKDLFEADDQVQVDYMDGMENEKKAEKEDADTKLPALASG